MCSIKQVEKNCKVDNIFKKVSLTNKHMLTEHLNNSFKSHFKIKQYMTILPAANHCARP